jgi:hypothetical protein
MTNVQMTNDEIMTKPESPNEFRMPDFQRPKPFSMAVSACSFCIGHWTFIRGFGLRHFFCSGHWSFGLTTTRLPGIDSPQPIPYFPFFLGSSVAAHNWPHRLEAQDTALSRPRRGFESRWGHSPSHTNRLRGAFFFIRQAHLECPEEPREVYASRRTVAVTARSR